MPLHSWEPPKKMTEQERGRVYLGDTTVLGVIWVSEAERDPDNPRMGECWETCGHQCFRLERGPGGKALKNYCGICQKIPKCPKQGQTSSREGYVEGESNSKGLSLYQKSVVGKGRVDIWTELDHERVSLFSLFVCFSLCLSFCCYCMRTSRANSNWEKEANREREFENARITAWWLSAIRFWSLSSNCGFAS